MSFLREWRRNARLRLLLLRSERSNGGGVESSFVRFLSARTAAFCLVTNPNSELHEVAAQDELATARIKEEGFALELPSAADRNAISKKKNKQTRRRFRREPEPAAANNTRNSLSPPLHTHFQPTHRQLRHGEPQRERQQEEHDIDGVGPHLERGNFRVLKIGRGEKKRESARS